MLSLHLTMSRADPARKTALIACNFFAARPSHYLPGAAKTLLRRIRLCIPPYDWSNEDEDNE